MLRGEIASPNHYCLPKGKIEGTRSMPYYSIEPNYLLLTYFIIITHIVSKESYEEQKKKVRVYCQRTYLPFCK
jgi:hypothetical protein